MKEKIIKILFIFGAFVTLSVLLYPAIADFVNSSSQSKVVSHYLDDVETMDDEQRDEILSAAHEFNRNLLIGADRFNFSDEDIAIYKRQLDTGHGVMGILKIDKINVNLPIYHGTDEGVLQIGAGHLQGTSLPVGGIGTHSFITGHRGLPSSKLLSDLDKMAVGDLFTIYIMGEALTYKVDNIQTVTPDHVKAFDIYSDKDYCTLVTCTPYGINTHRLLVRGYRVDNVSEQIVTNNATEVEKIVLIGIFMIPILPITITIAIINYTKRCKKGRYY